MKAILTGILLMTGVVCLSAQDTIYINKNKVVDKSQAKEYVLLSRLSKKQVLASFYTMEGKLRQTAECSKFTKKEQIRNGTCTEYRPSGAIRSICTYQEGRPNGRKTVYFPNGQPELVTLYEMGKMLKLEQYYRSGLLKRTEVYAYNGSDVVTEGHLYDEEGNETEFFPYNEPPRFDIPGGGKVLAGILTSEIKYPPELAKEKLEGRVVIRCEISPKGEVTALELHEKAHPLFNKEAVRVVETLIDKYGVVPGSREGVLTKMNIMVPVNFRLTN